MFSRGQAVGYRSKPPAAKAVQAIPTKHLVARGGSELRGERSAPLIEVIAGPTQIADGDLDKPERGFGQCDDCAVRPV